MDKEQQERLCRAARSYLGVQWRGQGRDHTGVDCVGFVICAFRDAGFEVNEPRPDYRGVDTVRLRRLLDLHCQNMGGQTKPQVGDIVLYGVPWDAHIALLVDGAPLNAMHCPMNGKVIEARFEPTRGHIRGIFRWRS